MPDNKESPTTKKLIEKLVLKSEMVWDKISPKEKEQVFAFAEGYKDFLNKAKTEREAVKEITKFATTKGFKEIKGKTKGEKFYRQNRKKMIALAVLGKRPFKEGMRIIVSHIDSPRLDLKQNPLYQEADLAMLKTHYYGGIKKYQWVCRPLALHGKIIRKDGQEIDLNIGETENDPVFTISDLLPHLAHNVQGTKKISEAIVGEKLNIIVGSIPFPDKKAGERVKLAILNYLNEKFSLVEEDFISAELEAVPAEKARDIGWDRSLIGAYGHDDRVCAYASMQAIGEIKKPEYTSLCVFFDKEEIGSEGDTGAKSRFLETIADDLLELSGSKGEESVLRKAFMNSRALSADVNGAIDPDYQDVHEKRNAAKMGYGLCVTKFTGSRGKSGSSDAHAEYLGWLRRLFNENNVVWQTGELGKVDEGGGGTVAKFLAQYGMEIVDCGTSVLGMHSPFEIASKADIYMTYKGYKTFFDSAG